MYKAKIMYELICDNCENWFKANTIKRIDTIFADPPDNIGLKYNHYIDKIPDYEYIEQLRKWLKLFIMQSRCVWFSFNVKWWSYVGRIITELQGKQINVKLCVQTFNFGQYRQEDLSNNFRPLLRIMWDKAPLYPDAIRVTSWRQEHGDSRADPRGRVPSDVFDIPRVTGNSKQRRSYHPTQLNEALVERCIKLTTLEGEHVLDPFAGTGTTLRVCERINRACTLIEIDPSYCEQIAMEHNLKVE